MSTSKRESWRRHVHRWVESGLSCKAYAKQSKVNHHTLSWWKRQLASEGDIVARRRIVIGKASPSFVEIEVSADTRSETTPIVLEVGGATISIQSGFCKQTLRDVVSALRGCQ